MCRQYYLEVNGHLLSRSVTDNVVATDASVSSPQCPRVVFFQGERPGRGPADSVGLR